MCTCVCVCACVTVFVRAGSLDALSYTRHIYTTAKRRGFTLTKWRGAWFALEGDLLRILSRQPQIAGSTDKGDPDVLFSAQVRQSVFSFASTPDRYSRYRFQVCVCVFVCVLVCVCVCVHVRERER